MAFLEDELVRCCVAHPRESVLAWRGPRAKENGSGGIERIRKALAAPGRSGVRKIAERFGVDPGTVQRISRRRPFAEGAASVVV
jgi:hypothetical protein